MGSKATRTCFPWKSQIFGSSSTTGALLTALCVRRCLGWAGTAGSQQQPQPLPDSGLILSVMLLVNQHGRTQARVVIFLSPFLFTSCIVRSKLRSSSFPFGVSGTRGQKNGVGMLTARSGSFLQPSQGEKSIWKGFSLCPSPTRIKGSMPH